MRPGTLASRYLWAIAVLGSLLWLGTLWVSAPWHHPSLSVLEDAAILLTLTVLSTLSPIETRGGGTLTVALAPLFGAVILPLPSWAVMTVAAIGTIDQRVPGRQIPWKNFFFNRGMLTISYGLPSLFVTHANPVGWSEVALVIVGAALMIMLFNTALTAVAVSLLRGSPIFRTTQAALSGNAFTYLAMPFIGILIAHLLGDRGLSVLLVFLLYGPLLIYRASIQKQRRLDTWLRDSYIMQSRVVDKRDGQTFGHSQRVGELCETVARLLHLTDEACNTIRVGGILHDLGKIAVPDSILLKPGKLTPEEYEIIKQHPVEGAQILAEHPEQRDVAIIVRHHHERWDGAGYPDGLKGEAIPIGSRIVNACDAFDTITQARVFRPTVKTPEEAIRELRQLAGTWYDPSVIMALEKIVAERWDVQLPAAATTPLQAPIGYRDLLALRPFRLLWIGQGVSYFGDMMNTTALAIMLFLITRSPSVVALGLIAKAAPTILFGLVAGSFVDRVDRQRLMIGADLIRALLTVTIPFFALRWLPGVFIAVFLIATASAFFNPAKQAILPNLVPNAFLVRANGLMSSSEKVMELLGYSTAGIIAAIVSFVPLFLIDAATYLVSAVTLLGVVDVAHRVVAKKRRLREDILEGARFILNSPSLRSTMALTFAAVFFAGMTFPILVIMAYGPLHGGAVGYGILEAAIGAGAIFGALAAAPAMTRYSAGTLILAGVAGIGLAEILVGFTQNIVMALILLFLGGITNTIYYVPLISLTQRESPDYIRGRVMSTRFLLVQLGLLGGMAIAGPLTDRVGAPVVYVASGLLLLITATLGLAFPSLRKATLRSEEIPRTVKATASG
jgi:putative nucleotidyltransferase with HDIG domain